MRSQGFKVAMACLLFALSCPVLWGADLNIQGNVNVQGDGSDTAPGNLRVNGTLITHKVFQVFTVISGEQPKDLGEWDFCFLSMVRFQAMGECLVKVPTGKVEGGGKWSLFAFSSDAKLKAMCSAGCLNFTKN